MSKSYSFSQALNEVRRIKIYLQDIDITHMAELDSDNIAELNIISELDSHDIMDILKLLLDKTPFLENDMEV